MNNSVPPTKIPRAEVIELPKSANWFLICLGVVCFIFIQSIIFSKIVEKRLYSNKNDSITVIQQPSESWSFKVSCTIIGENFPTGRSGVWKSGLYETEYECESRLGDMIDFTRKMILDVNKEKYPSCSYTHCFRKQ